LPSFLRTVEDVITRQMYTGAQMHIVPRGLVYPLDIGGLGKVRFGKKVGNLLPLLTPDNSYELVEDAIYLTDSLVVERNPMWIDVGGYVYVAERELHKVDDVVDDTIYIEGKLLADHVTGQRVYHYSNPIKIEGSYDVGQDVIVVDSSYFMVRGDVISIPKATVGVDVTITTFVDYKVIDLLGVSVVNGIYQYQLTLDRRLVHALADETIVQLKANLAYQSKILNVPSTSGFQRRVSGPFVVDWVSAPLRNKLELDETQTLYLYTTARSQLEDPRVVEKNSVILREPIRADQFLFWDKVDGGINYDNGLKRFVMLPNKNGEWRIKHKCVPLLDPPSKTATGVIATVDPGLLNNNEGFILDDSEDTVIFEYEVNGAYVPTPSSAASGSISVGGMPTNNQWIQLDDGFGTILQFEFKVNSSFSHTIGFYTLDVSSAVVPTDVAILIQEFINNLSGFQITAIAAGILINLNHEHVSTRGNKLVVLDGTLVGWLATGMSGGTDDVKTIDITAATTDMEVAQLTSAAINSQQMYIKADWPVLVPSMLLTTSIEGIAANKPIVKNVAAPGFSVSGMSGGYGGMQWNVSIKPITDALFRIRFYPNDWTSYNLTGGVDNNISVFIDANDDPVEMIDMLISTDPHSEVLMKEWALTGPRVGALKYEYVARHFGAYDFVSTTLLLKQMFQSIDDVASIHDAGFALDSGFVKAGNP